MFSQSLNLTSDNYLWHELCDVVTTRRNPRRELLNVSNCLRNSPHSSSFAPTCLVNASRAMNDKRSHPRFEVSLTVQLPECAAGCQFRISDLSMTGCYVDAIAEVVVGQVLLLRILRPDGESFQVNGIVTHHVRRLGFGVQFADLDEVQETEMRALIETT